MEQARARAELVDGEFWVVQPAHVRLCWQSLMGFGKGNLSRSEPVYARVVTGRVDSGSLGKAIRGMVRAVGGSSQARDPHVEHLHLAPYEAAYLVFDERLLIVSGLEGAPALWEYCRGRWPEFLRQYAVYRAYRRAGWALHSGCKYGADFVLYRFQRARARHVHAPYTVLVRRHDEPVQRRWIALQNQLRMTKQVAKRLVYVSLDDAAVRHCERERERWLAGVQLREVLVDRWTAENKRGKNEEPS